MDRITPVGAAFTVTLHTAFLPLKVLTEMFVLPAFRAVTRPWGSTVATSGWLDFHVSAEDELPGRVATRDSSSPAPRVAFDLLRVTFEGALTTVTTHSAFTPLWAVAVMVTGAPLAFMPLITPDDVTFATLGLLDS